MCVGQKTIVLDLVLFPKTEHGSKVVLHSLTKTITNKLIVDYFFITKTKLNHNLLTFYNYN